MGPPLALTTLGAFRVEVDGQPVEFTRQKARTLLAVLLCAGAPVHRETLVDCIWPVLTLDRGLAALYSTLYTLRRALDPGLRRAAASSRVVADAEAYRLVLDEGDAWDATRFLRLAADAAAAGPAATHLDRLEAAEAAYDGPFLPQWPYADWAAPRRIAVEEARILVLERLALGLAESRQTGAAIARYRMLLAREPEREDWHRGLMRVYAGAGERALALRQFQRCRALLLDRWGVEPGPETRALEATLRNGDGGA